ncbi:MAG: HlyD family efflux transporter periplasmic adaptor subunit, partial [Nitrospirota bacterium]
SVLKVEVPFDETDFMVIKRGQKVNITSDANPGKVLKGKVVYVSPVVSKAAAQNRTIDVEINFDQPNKDTLPVGASVDAEIILETKNDAVVVPTNAVIERDEVKFVYTVVIDRVEKRNVSTGISSWEYMEILDGVREGERVITSLDVVGLEEGKRVNISNESNKQ